MLMVEADGVHHLMLDMAGQVGAAAKLDGLSNWERKEGHPDPARTTPGVVKGYIVALVRLLDPLYTTVKLVVVVLDRGLDRLRLVLTEVSGDDIRDLALWPEKASLTQSITKESQIWDGVAQFFPVFCF